MSKLKSVLKSKKFWLILGIVVLVILVFAIPIFNIYKENKNARNNIENDYTFYIRNNGELEAEIYYSEKYVECWRPFERYICSDIDSFVEEVSFKNNEIEEIYKNVDFKGLSLKDALILYFSIERDDYNNVTISSSYKLDEKIKQEIIENIDINIGFIYSDNVLTEETNFYTISFDTDGGTSIDSIVIAPGYTFELPVEPTKDGYTFLYWALDGEEYDFTAPITSDITLTAIWKENKTSSNNNNSSNNNSNNTNHNGSSTSKINLNNNISITEYHINSGTFDCFYYMFVTNLKEVFPKAEISKINNNPAEVNFWHNKDRQEDEVSTEEITEYLTNGSLKINTSAENNFKNILNKYENGNYKGIANVTYTEDNHRFIFSYDYISFNGLSVSSNGEAANKEIQTALSSSTKFNGPCGGFGNYENKILTEELCSKYNLDCDRW